MAATIQYFGSYSAKISLITLSATSVEAIGHALPTTPDRYWSVLTGSAGNTSLAGSIIISAVGATSVQVKTDAGATVSGEVFLEIAHSLTA